MESLLRVKEKGFLHDWREISFEEQEQRASRFSIPYFLKPASLLAACFLCGLLFFYNQPEEKVFAYVSVDINQV